MNPSEGQSAVKIARQAVELWTREKQKLKPKDYPESFNEKRGVFVTLHTWPEKHLRGCIGFPGPVYPLIDALVEAAVSACQDPRFPPLQQEELDKITVEVSVLTKPELIEVSKPEDYPKHIRIGKDGLIVRKGFFSGLLLPQVATEWKFDSEEFLSQTCQKAGLPPDAWLEPGTRVYRFQSEIFSEKKPGEV